MQNLDISTLWNRKWTILLVTLLAVGAGAFYINVAEDVYESQAKLLVARSQNATDSRPVTTERYFLATQAEIMGSSLIVTKAMESLGRPIDIPMEELLESVRVSPMDDTDVMSVIVRDKDPATAEALVGAIVDTYSGYVRDIEQKRSSESVQAIVKRERELSEELEAAQTRYVELRKNSPLVGSDGDGIRIEMARLEQLSNDLSSVTNLRIDLDNQIQLARRTGRVPVGRGADASRFRLTSTARNEGGDGYSEDLQTTHIMDDLRAAQGELSDARRRYGENHPRARSASEKVEALNSALKRHNNRITQAMDQRLAAAKSLEEKLNREYAELLKTTKAMDQFMVEEQTLSKKITRLGETQQLLVTTLSQARLAESELNNGLASIDVRPLDGPTRLTEKVWPRPSLVLGLAGVLGFGLGCLIAVCSTGLKNDPPTVATTAVNG
jgi:uncharacterized protein involved in exopolysaccharide biosynthesis